MSKSFYERLRMPRTKETLTRRIRTLHIHLRRGSLDQKGIVIVETLVALAILGVISVGFLSAIATSYTAVRLSDQRTTAESVARTVIERVRVAPYPLATGVVGGLDGGLPSGFAVEVSVANSTEWVGTPPSPVQLVTVVVKHQGRTIVTSETYKADPNINLPQSGAGG